MNEKYFCGSCGSEFEPKPYMYGGDHLCDSCIDKKSEKIQKAKRSYDEMSHEDRQNINFASAIGSSVPQRRVELVCPGCGSYSSDGRMCSSCVRDEDRRRIEEERKEDKARREFERLKGNL